MIVEGLLGVPKKVCLMQASTEGTTLMNAFDNALMLCKIGDTSIVKLSSILPPNVEFVLPDEFDFVPGSLVPCILAFRSSKTAGEKITAALSLLKTENGPILVAEKTAVGLDLSEAKEEVTFRAFEMARARKLKHDNNPQVIGAEHVVEKIGAVMAVCIIVS